MKLTRTLLFDVLGTVVDWRSTIAREVGVFLSRHGASAVDPGEFADEWAARYGPATEELRQQRRPFAPLDILNRENLEATLIQVGLDPLGLPRGDLDNLNLAWHRVEPWPDALEGLAKLKQHHVIAPLSGGNTSMLLDISKRAGLPWDTVLGSDLLGAYKPAPEAYRRMAEILGVQPRDAMLVAAHNDDLAGARRCGMATAFVCRPAEHGPGQTTDLVPMQDWDFVADDLPHLARLLTT